MTHNNRLRPGGGRRQTRSIDGISRGGSPSLGGEGSISFRRPYSYRPEQQVGNFAQSEGFNPTDQGKVISSADTQELSTPKEEPMTQTENFDIPTKKKRLFGGKKGTPNPKQLGRGGKLRKVLGKGIIGITAVVLLGGGFLFIKGYLKARQVFKGGSDGAAALVENVDPSRLRGEGDGRVNILLLGKGGEGHTAPDLTDTILIASIDPLHNEAAILSLPRDLYVKVPGNGSMKINAVYATAKQAVLAKGKQSAGLKAQAEKAGLQSIEKTVEETIGIPIHYYSIIDFEGFKKAIDTVGGVDINVPKALLENMRIDGQNYKLDVKTGWQHFDGFRALAYSRSRLTSARGDFDRSERQRLMIIALKDKILSAGTYANPVKVSQLIDAFGNHIQTNLTIDEMLRLQKIGGEIPTDKITSIGLADPPHAYLTTANVGGLSVVLPKAGAGNYKEIQSFIRNTLKDGFLRKENAQITVLNGSTKAGAAATKAEELKSYGYTVTVIGDAPTKTYTKTVLVDLTGGSMKYTKRYLEQRLGVSAVSQLPDSSITPGTANFVIIVGQ